MKDRSVFSVQFLRECEGSGDNGEHVTIGFDGGRCPLCDSLGALAAANEATEDAIDEVNALREELAEDGKEA